MYINFAWVHTISLLCYTWYIWWTCQIGMWRVLSRMCVLDYARFCTQLWQLFILFSNVFFILIHNYTLCFTGFPCCNVSNYNSISIGPYYIVIHMTILYVLLVLPVAMLVTTITSLYDLLYSYLHDYTLCFNGSPCYNVSYYNYISIWPTI